MGPFPLVSGTQILTTIVYDIHSGQIIGESSWENQFGQRDLVPEGEREFLFKDFRNWVRR